MNRILISSVALATLAGCATVPPPAAPTGPCVVDDAMRMHLIGTDFKMAQRDEIQHRANAPVVRVLRPGDAATRDLRPDRLSIMLDEDGKVNELLCG